MAASWTVSLLLVSCLGGFGFDKLYVGRYDWFAATILSLSALFIVEVKTEHREVAVGLKTLFLLLLFAQTAVLASACLATPLGKRVPQDFVSWYPINTNDFRKVQVIDKICAALAGAFSLYWLTPTVETKKNLSKSKTK